MIQSDPSTRRTEKLAQLVPRIRALVLDMDGVLWAGDTALIDMPQAFRRMRDLGLRVVLTTNNATKTVEQLYEKVRSFGVDIEPEQIINASLAVADILKQRFPAGGPVYVFGEEGLRSTLKEHGYYHCNKDVLAVVVGLNRYAVFSDFCDATNLIRGGAFFVGTSPDSSFPQSNGTFVPGGGPFVAFMETSTNVKATIAGKPSPCLFELALKRVLASPEETLAVGDRLDTDIVGAQRAGCRTGLVLTGSSTLRDLESFFPPPDLVASDLLAILDE